MKPLLSDKSCIKDKIKIYEKGEILKTESENAETLYSFLNLEISGYNEFDPTFREILLPSSGNVHDYVAHI